MADSATLSGRCPNCENEVAVRQVWEPGGVNDYGGYILRCAKCQRPFDFHVGRDIQMSRVLSGATVLETYDDEIDGDKKAAFERQGLSDTASAPTSIYAELPPQSKRPNVSGYFARDPSGNRIPVAIVGVRIEQKADGKVTLTRITDGGQAVNPTKHADVASAKGAATKEFAVPDLAWKETGG